MVLDLPLGTVCAKVHRRSKKIQERLARQGITSSGNLSLWNRRNRRNVTRTINLNDESPMNQKLHGPATPLMDATAAMDCHHRRGTNPFASVRRVPDFMATCSARRPPSSNWGQPHVTTRAATGANRGAQGARAFSAPRRQWTSGQTVAVSPAGGGFWKECSGRFVPVDAAAGQRRRCADFCYWPWDRSAAQPARGRADVLAQPGLKSIRGHIMMLAIMPGMAALTVN